MGAHQERRRRRRALLFLVLGFAGIGGLLRLWIGPLPDPEGLLGRAPAPGVRILDRHGRLLYEIAPPHQGRHTWVPLSRIPRACVQATLATEDARFYEHPGVDPIAILRALWMNLRGEGSPSGASTIPQQIARALLLEPDERTARTLRRKVREALLALELSRRYGKDELLEIYLNTVFYGHFAYGLEAAARTYFGKHAGELDTAECALLAGLPQAPSRYDPLTRPEAAEERRQQVLRLMVRHGFLSPEEAAIAAAERLRFASVPFPIHAPHFVMAIREALVAQFGEEAMFQEGLVVTTTLDLAWNEAITGILRHHLAEINRPRPDRPGAGARNGAVVVLDPQTGEVLAWVGSPDYFDATISGAVDGVRIPRQPGSALKPFTYALAFDPRSGPLLTPASLLWDLPQTFITAEGEGYQPINYDRRYHGPVSARVALASSLNVPAVAVLEQVGVPRLLDLLDRLGVQLPGPPTRYGLSLTLGGGEVRLAGSYGGICRAGQRRTPGDAHPDPRDPGSPWAVARSRGAEPRPPGPGSTSCFPDHGYPERPGCADAGVRGLEPPAAGPAGRREDGNQQRLAGQLDHRLHPRLGGGCLDRERGSDALAGGFGGDRRRSHLARRDGAPPSRPAGSGFPRPGGGAPDDRLRPFRQASDTGLSPDPGGMVHRGHRAEGGR
jgi:membrane carboxypeptidase/penicillin-binding protein PbpC